MFRAVVMLLCSAITQVVIANVACAKTILPFVEMAKPRLTIDSECIPVFNIPSQDGPFIVHNNVLNISISNWHVESNNSPVAGRYEHISRNNDFSISCNIFFRRFAKHLQVCYYINAVSGRLTDVQRDHTRMGEIPRFPDVNSVRLDIDVGPQLPFRSLLSKSSLVASGNGGVAGRESANS